MSIEATTQTNLEPLYIEAYKDPDCNISTNKKWKSDFSPTFKDFEVSIEYPQVINPIGIDNFDNGISKQISRFKCEIEIQKPFNAPNSSSKDNYVLNKYNDLTNILKYDGSLHRIPFLKLTCAEMIYKTKLTKYKVIEERYSKSRELNFIKLNLYLQEVESVDFELKRKNMQSPDVTHYYLVKDGDNLLKISQEMYGSTSYYLQIAKFNQLSSIRNLEVGSRLMLPALK